MGDLGCQSPGDVGVWVQLYGIDTVLGVILDLGMPFDRPVAKTLGASFLRVLRNF